MTVLHADKELQLLRRAERQAGFSDGGNTEWVRLERVDGGELEEHMLPSLPAEGDLALNGQSQHVWSDQLDGSGALSRQKPRVEGDESQGAAEAIESPEEEGGPDVDAVTIDEN